MMTLKKYGRLWHIYGEEALLAPWAENPEKIRGDLIKQNSKRSVWHVTSEDNNDYYVKRELKFRLPFIASKAEKEYRAFALLEKKQIPCAKCVAWSATFHDSILVTRALPETFYPLLEFWYRKPEADLKFTRKLCDFLAKLVHAGIYHPDLHTGNLMTDGEDIVLIDPVGITETNPDNVPHYDMLVPLTVSFGEIPVEQVAEQLHRAGLFSSVEETLDHLLGMEKQQRDQIEDEWGESGKRRKQMLSGISKFATEVEPGIFFRNSAWYSSLTKYPEGISEVEELPENEAMEIWINSFRCQLLKEKLEKIPVIYEKKGGKVKIFYLKDKKYSFFYGFR